MKEFQVNDYITLKLEDAKTIIYVAGERFQQCKYLLIDIPLEEVESFEEIRSIDEVSEKLDRSLENPNKEGVNIKPEVEFWGHCSNLQAWYENNYDTRFLHSNLAFPLLKKLIEAGDPLAQKVFRDEIAKKLTDESNPVALYLYGRNYVKYLTRKEFWSLFGSDGEIIYKMEKQLKKFQKINGKKYYEQNIDDFEYFKLSRELGPDFGPTIFNFEKGRVTGIGIYGDEKFIAEDNSNIYSEDLGYLELEELPDSLGNLASLKKLELFNIGLKMIPKSIKNLKNLEELSIAYNPDLNLPDVLWKLKSLKILDLSNNNLKTIPESIERLENLQELHLYGNCMESFPKQAIDKLNKLRAISLEGEKYLSKLDNETLEWLRKY
jgi:hypothetical protein